MRRDVLATQRFVSRRLSGQHPAQHRVRLRDRRAASGAAGGRTTKARALLTPVYGRFTEGFGTADLQAAKRILELVG